MLALSGNARYLRQPLQSGQWWSSICWGYFQTTHMRVLFSCSFHLMCALKMKRLTFQIDPCRRQWIFKHRSIRYGWIVQNLEPPQSFPAIWFCLSIVYFEQVNACWARVTVDKRVLLFHLVMVIQWHEAWYGCLDSPYLPAGLSLLKVNKMWNMFKVNNKDNRRSGVFIINFEHISHLVLVFLLLTFNM